MPAPKDAKIGNARLGRSLLAVSDIPKDSVIIKLDGHLLGAPTRTSIQVNSYQHLEVDFDNGFLNHSCDPNAYIDYEDLTLRALEDIKEGEEVTFCYLATEYQLATPFACNCQKPGCFGLIKGFSYLNPYEKERIAHLLAPHLKEIYEKELAETNA